MHSIEKGELRRLFLAIVTFATITIVMSWRLSTQITVYGDTPLVTKDSIDVILKYITHLWHDEALGTNQPWSFVHLFAVPLLKVSDYVNVNLYYLSRVLFIFLSQVTFYFLTIKFIDEFSARLYSSILYVVNPVFVMYYNMGGTLIIWVLLPLYIKCLYELAFEGKDSLSRIVLVSVLLGTLILSSPTFLVTYMLLLLIPIIYYIKNRGKEKIAKLTLLVSISLLLILPCLYANIHYYGTSPSGLTYQIVSDFKYTYQELSPIKFVLLIGNRGSPQQSLEYLDNNIFLDLGSIVALGLFSLGLISMGRKVFNHQVRREDINMLCSVLLTFLVIISLVVMIRFFTYTGLSFIIERVTPLWTLRNPIKLQVGFTPVFAIIVGTGLQKFMYHLESLLARVTTNHLECKANSTTLKRCIKKIINVSVLSTLIMLILYIVYPLTFNSAVLRGDMGLSRTYKYTLGELYDEKLACLARVLKDETHRGIIVPFDHKTELYIQFHAPLFYIGKLGEISDAVKYLEEALSSGHPILARNVLKLFSIDKVILQDKNMGIYFSILTPRLPLNKLAEILDQELRAETTCSYSTFRMKKTLPLIYVTEGAVYYSNELTFLLFVEDIFLENKYVFLRMPKYATFIGDNIIVEYYKLSPVINGFYNFKCYHTWCRLKIWNHTMIKEFEIPKNSTKSIYLEEGTYSLEVVLPAVTYKLGELILDNNKVYLTSTDNNFLLNADIKIIKGGPFPWNSFYMFLNAVNKGVSYKVILHADGLIEVARIADSEYIPAVRVWHFGDSFLNKNINVQLFRMENIFYMSINGKTFFIFIPELEGDINIEIGSDNSVTRLSNAGIALFEKEHLLIMAYTETTDIDEKAGNDVSVVRKRPTEISIVLSDLNKYINRSLFVVFNERFSKYWEVEGAIKVEHFKANLFFNGFLIRPFNKEIIIRYRDQSTYDKITLLSVIFWVLSSAYLISTQTRSLLRRSRKASSR